MKIYLNVFIFFVILIGLSACKSLPVPKNGIEVEFPYLNGKSSDKQFIIPAYMKPPYLYPISSKKDSSQKNIPKKIEEVKIDGVLAYYITSSIYPQRFVSKDKFDKIKPGLTLRQIVKILGPGYTYAFSGIWAIHWTCKDGRSLSVWPHEYKLDKKFKFIFRINR